MMKINVGRPSELIKVLSAITPCGVRHLQVRTHSHFWHTHDCIKTLSDKVASLVNLESLEFIGSSYPNLFDITRFLEFLHESSTNIKNLVIPISPPFPGQYPIQDRSFMVNKILHMIFRKNSLMKVRFYSKYDTLDENESITKIPDKDEWVSELNRKINGLIRNHGASRL
jgi:hypothetical protein